MCIRGSACASFFSFLLLLLLLLPLASCFFLYLPGPLPSPMHHRVVILAVSLLSSITLSLSLSLSLFLFVSISVSLSFYLSPPLRLSVYFLSARFYLPPFLPRSLLFPLSPGASPIFLDVSLASMRVSRSEGCVREYCSSGRNVGSAGRRRIINPGGRTGISIPRRMIAYGPDRHLLYAPFSSVFKR